MASVKGAICAMRIGVDLLAPADGWRPLMTSSQVCCFACNGVRLRALQRTAMDGVSTYARRPVAFLLRYVRQRAFSHSLILTAVVAAASCSVSAQYAVKFLVDSLTLKHGAGAPWLAFALLAVLAAGDNLLWRSAGWIASYAF